MPLRVHGRADAVRIIRASKSLGLISFCPPAQKKMVARNLDANDVSFAIRNGDLVAIEETRYRWHGPSVDDPERIIEMVFEIDEGEAVEVVTVFESNPETRRH